MKFGLVLVLVLGMAGCGGTPKMSDHPDTPPEPIPSLEFVLPDGRSVRTTRTELESQLPIAQLMVLKHPAYQKENKSYDGFTLVKLLSHLDPQTNYMKSAFWIKVHCLDGYETVYLSSKRLRKGNALLAIRETPGTQDGPESKDRLWSMVRSKGKWFDPAPFYLVWNDPKVEDIMPFQIDRITVTTTKPTGKIY